MTFLIVLAVLAVIATAWSLWDFHTQEKKEHDRELIARIKRSMPK